MNFNSKRGAKSDDLTTNPPSKKMKLIATNNNLINTYFPKQEEPNEDDDDDDELLLAMETNSTMAKKKSSSMLTISETKNSYPDFLFIVKSVDQEGQLTNSGSSLEVVLSRVDELASNHLFVCLLQDSWLVSVEFYTLF
jgi:hypothetical protein